MTDAIPEWARHVVLVLEDDATLVPFFSSLFRRLKCHHILVTNKEAAEALLAKGGLCLGCVDLKVPSAPDFPAEIENGLDFIRESRERHEDARVFPMIAMTAFGDDHRYCLRSVELGANTFFKKPTDTPPLDEKVRTWLQKGCETLHPEGCPHVRRPAQKADARSYPSTLRLMLHGEPIKGGYRVGIDKKPVPLTEQHVELLVKLTLVDRARADGYADFNDLGFDNYEAFRQAIRRLIQALEKHGGADLIEKHGKQVRIGTSNVVLEEKTLKPNFGNALKWRPPTKSNAT